MAKLKVLRSIGHNLAHSYLSLMNYRQDDYVCSVLERLSREHSQYHIVIDVLNCTIEPHSFNIDVIRDSIIDLKQDLIRNLQSDKLTVEHIKSTIITIDFDIENLQRRPSGLEVVPYLCVVKIEDCNGKIHQATVREWWH
jgi:hypothetical protein